MIKPSYSGVVHAITTKILQQKCLVLLCFVFILSYSTCFISGSNRLLRPVGAQSGRPPVHPAHNPKGDSISTVQLFGVLTVVTTANSGIKQQFFFSQLRPPIVSLSDKQRTDHQTRLWEWTGCIRDRVGNFPNNELENQILVDVWSSTNFKLSNTNSFSVSLP